MSITPPTPPSAPGNLSSPAGASTIVPSAGAPPAAPAPTLSGAVDVTSPLASPPGPGATPIVPTAGSGADPLTSSTADVPRQTGAGSVLDALS
jgi:hypothetical protein